MKGRYMQIDEQVGKLQRLISHKCVDSRRLKRSVCMRMSIF